MARIAYWLLLAVTLVLCAIMVGWSVPTLRGLAHGVELFDMRMGYGLDDAVAIVTALGPAGAAFYRSPQHVLDTAVPPLLALTLFFAIASLAPARWGRWRWAVAAIALPAAPLDLMENHLVDLMLDAGPNGLAADLVATASMFTVLKYGVLIVAFALVVGFGAARLIDRRRAA